MRRPKPASRLSLVCLVLTAVPSCRNPGQFTKLMDVNGSFPIRAQDFDTRRFIAKAAVSKEVGGAALGKDALPMWKDFFAGSHPAEEEDEAS